MTITMNLEVEVGISFGDVISILSAIGAEYRIEDGFLTGNFAKSNIYFVFHVFSLPEKVAAEGGGI